MKIIQNKKFIQKIFLLLLIVVSFNFICPKIVNAEVDESDSLGGVLINGVTDLFVALADGVVNLSHMAIMGQEDSLIRVEESGWAKLGNVIVAVLVGLFAAALIAAAVFIPMAGVSLGISALVGTVTKGLVIKVAITSAALGAVGGGYIGYSKYSDMADVLDLPVYTISPQEIFYGQIPLLNVNFFEPETRNNLFNELFTNTIDVSNNTIGAILVQYGADMSDIALSYVEPTPKVGDTEDSKKITSAQWNYDGKTYSVEIIYLYKTHSKDTRIFSFTVKEGDVIKESSNDVEYYEGTGNPINHYKEHLISNYGYPTGAVEECNDIEVFSKFKTNENTLEWIDEENNSYVLTVDGNTKNLKILKNYTNIASALQPTVAKWFVTLRNVALVISMSILVYVGIRMMLTSIAAEKAKYKTMLVDWFIGVGLIFVMQYIMVFGTTLNDKFINLVSASSEGVVYSIFNKNDKWNMDILKNNGFELVPVDTANGIVTLTRNQIACMKDSEGNEFLIYPTNLMGDLRISLQNNRDGSLIYVGYAIAFMVLAFYTIFFLITYIKRVIYMAFLTIISPFVAMTYSIDKLTDGKAQAFNMWLKEYIFNLLIQPMHLLLYYILIISAFDLAGENILYTLVAIGFMVPAEKLIRKFFGFDKAQTPGFLGGAAGAALVMSTVGSLRRFSNSGKGKSDKEKDNKNADGKIRTKSEKLIEADQVFNDSDSAAASNIRTTEGKLAETESSAKSSTPEEAGSSTSDKTNLEDKTSPDNASDEPSATSEPDDLKFSKRGALRGIGRHAWNGAAKFTGKIPGLAARGFGAATLGAVGLAAGIASGDPNNALQYTLTGGAAGSALGAGLANRAYGAGDRVVDDWLRGGYGEDYDEYMNRKADKMFLRSKENQDFYRSMFGDDYENAMNDAIEYRKRGITDNKIIAKAMKLKGYTPTMQLYLAQLASGISSRSDWAREREKFKRQGLSDAQISIIEKGLSSMKNWK